MIRKLLADLRDAAGDPFVITSVGLMLLSTGSQGVIERLVDLRDDVARLRQTSAELAELSMPAGAATDPAAPAPAAVAAPAEATL